MMRTQLSPESRASRELVRAHRSELEKLLEKYQAQNPRFCGSVARGTADSESDIDIIVQMDPSLGNVLMRASGLMEETRKLLGRDDIDIFPEQLLKPEVARSIQEDAVDV